MNARTGGILSLNPEYAQKFKRGTADDFLDRYAALPSAARNSAGVRPPSASLRLSVL